MSKKIAVGDIGLCLYNVVLLILSKLLFDNEILNPHSILIKIIVAVLLLCGNIWFWKFSYSELDCKISGRNIALGLIFSALLLLVIFIFNKVIFGKISAEIIMIAFGMVGYQIARYFNTIVCYKEVHKELPSILNMIEYSHNSELNSAPMFLEVVTTIAVIIIAIFVA